MKLEEAIGKLLRERRATLAIAESCTGGLLCDRITDISGSSDYFQGGMVTYSNASKTKYLAVPAQVIKEYGAVSEEVARRMAEGVQGAFHTTFGLSTTGVAGPTGGTPSSPVGRVFIAVAAEAKTRVLREDLKGPRRTVKRQAAQKALELLYDYLTGGSHEL
jgi:nicotinamide-nucleotide amidase